VVISGGENVYPVEVERVLVGHPDVTEAAVIGVPDDRWGEAVHAVLVGTDLDLEAVRAHCGDHLARFKVPKSFEVVDALPRNASGKVRKDLLREPHWKVS
jgi:acyl-CoA synthetase (AMP-forming)/AMP-acid ligase II